MDETFDQLTVFSLDFHKRLKSYESKYTRNLQNNIITARESSPADLINLISNHAEGPFNDIKVPISVWDS